MAEMWLRLDVSCGSTGWTADLTMEQFGCWIKLLQTAKVGSNGGTLPESRFTEGWLCRNGTSREAWQAMIAAGIGDGAIVLTDGMLTINNWAKYQKDPTNARRQREHKQKEVTGRTLSPLGNGSNDDVDVDVDVDGTLQDKDKTPLPPFAALMGVHSLLSEDPAFIKAWTDWITHLTQKRKKPTKLAVTRQLTKCAKLGPVGAVAMIEHSITNNWQGLFAPDKPPAEKDIDAWVESLTEGTDESS